MAFLFLLTTLIILLRFHLSLNDYTRGTMLTIDIVGIIFCTITGILLLISDTETIAKHW